MSSENSTTELSVIRDSDLQISQPSNSFGNAASFEHFQRVALMLAKSELIPAIFQKKPENVMIALELANRVGASPLMVMQNLYIVHGKPAWSSQFLIATLNASGKFSSLRYEEDEANGGRTRAVATEKKSGEVCYGAWVSMEMAKAEGWEGKTGSKWKTMPELMRRYRAAAFFTRQFAPEISMGINSYEEAVEISSQPLQPIKAQEEVQADTELDRFIKVIEACDTIEKLNKQRKHLTKYPEASQVFLDKETLLENGEIVYNQTANV